MADRRALLRGLAALPAVAAASIATPATVVPVDPILALRQEWLARHDEFGRCPFTEEAEQAAYGRVREVERRVIASRATTPLGAITALEWARQDYLGDKHEGFHADHLFVALLDSALGVLRRQVA